MLVVGQGHQPDPLLRASAESMAFSEPASWVRKGSLPEPMLGGPGGSCKTSCALAPETSEHYFCHILFVKQVTKASPDAGGEELDSTSWCNVKITCEKSTQDVRYHCSYLWEYNLLQGLRTLQSHFRPDYNI